MTSTSEPATTSNLRHLAAWIVSLAAFGIVALVLVLAGGSDDDAEALTINDFVFTNEDGTTGTLANFHGQPLVVNFFASWCPPLSGRAPRFRRGP